jgi:hypothetical protein
MSGDAKLIDPGSAPATSTELELFSVPPTQAALDHGFWDTIHLTTTCTNTGPWEFIIHPDPYYLQLHRNYLIVRLQILKPDGSPCSYSAAKDHPEIAPINNIAQTFFSQVRVFISGKLVSDTGPYYAYRSYLQTLLNYSYDKKVAHLNVAGYFCDTNPVNIDAIANTGFQKRKNMFFNGLEVDVMAPIGVDVFQTDRLMLPYTEVRVELNRNANPFVLENHSAIPAAGNDTSMAGWSLVVKNMEWAVRKVALLPSTHMGIVAALQRHPTKYPLNRVEVTKIALTASSRTTPTTPVIHGQVPRRIIIGFVRHASFFGHIQNSPFKFENFNLAEIYLDVAGRNYPRKPIYCSYPTHNFSRAYVQMLEGLGYGNDNRANYILPVDFENYCCLYVFDLSPGEDDTSHWETYREGSIIINAKFAEDLPVSVQMLVYSEYDNLLMIDHNRNAYHDYQL